MIKVGILGLAQRDGTFGEVGLRSWEESGCGTVERVLLKAEPAQFVVSRPLVVRAVQSELEQILRDWSSSPHVESRCDLILTIGGDGLSPTDVFPDATSAVVDRIVPGVAEFLRQETATKSGLRRLASRGVAGVRGRTLIVNLPGPDPAEAEGAALALRPYLPELIEALKQA